MSDIDLILWTKDKKLSLKEFQSIIFPSNGDISTGGRLTGFSRGSSPETLYSLGHCASSVKIFF